MNIGILGRPSFTMGGGEHVTVELAKELERRGNDVTVFTPPFTIPDDPDNSGVEELEHAKKSMPFEIQTTESTLYGIKGVPLLWKKMLLHPWKALRTHGSDFDRWYVTYGVFSVTAHFQDQLNMVQYFHGPIIADKCGTIQRYTIYPPLSVLYYFTNGVDLPAAANSHRTAEWIDDVHNIKPEVVYPPVNLIAYQEAKSGAPEEPYVLLSGRFVPFKKFELGLQHLSGLDENVIVAGRLDDQPYFDRLKRDYPWATFETDVPNDRWISLHQNAEAYVFTNYEEDFGLTGAEAMSAGTPIVTPDGPGIAEIVKREGGGIVSPLTDLQTAIKSARNVNRREARQAVEGLSVESFVDKLKHIN